MKKPRDLRPTNNYALLLPLRSLQGLQAALAAGTAERAAVFEVSTPDIGPYPTAIVAGLGRALEQVAGLRFDQDALNFLSDYVDDATIAYLERFSFAGAISAYAEGEAFLAHSPIVTVEARLGEALLLEGLLTTALDGPSAIATAVGHLRRSVPNQRLYELWGPHGEGTGVYAAHAAYIAGADSTDNPLATRTGGDVPLYDLPDAQVVPMLGGELAAFTHLLATGPEVALPLSITDPATSVVQALAAAEAAHRQLFAVSLTPVENFPAMVRVVRAALDGAGNEQTNIILTVADPRLLDTTVLAGIAAGDLAVDALAVDFRALVGGASTLGMRYTLAELENAETGTFTRVDGIGRKVPYREFGDDWGIKREIMVVDPQQDIDHEWRALQTPYVHAGKIVQVPDLQVARDLARESLALPTTTALAVTYLPEPAIQTVAADQEEEDDADPSVITTTRRALQ